MSSSDILPESVNIWYVRERAHLSSKTFRYVGTGKDLTSCIPPILCNAVVVTFDLRYLPACLHVEGKGRRTDMSIQFSLAPVLPMYPSWTKKYRKQDRFVQISQPLSVHVSCEDDFKVACTNRV